jgi:hypothetical protein
VPADQAAEKPAGGRSWQEAEKPPGSPKHDDRHPMAIMARMIWCVSPLSGVQHPVPAQARLSAGFVKI